MARDGWRDVLLEEVAEDVTVGHVGTMASEYVAEGIPFLRSQNIEPLRVNESHLKFIAPTFHERLRKSALSPGDVVIVRTGKPGTCAVIPDSLPIANCSDLVIVRCGKDLDPDFLAYYVNSVAAHHIDSHLVGAVQQHFNVGSARKMLLHLPPLSEQRAIAHILGTLDDKIELNRRMNGTLAEMGRALFKSWFVDFDPVRANAEGRDPELPRHLADLFPVFFENWNCGEIPKGWEVKVLQDVLAELETGVRPKGGISEYTTGVPSIGAESIVGLGVFDYAKTRYVPQAFFDAMVRGRVRSRDVLLYKDGGRPGLFEPHVTLFGDGFPFDTCAINEHVYRLRAKSDFGQHLLFFSLSSDFVMAEMRTKGTGVAIPGLNSTQVKSLTMLVPPSKVALAFEALVEPWIARVLAACNESRTLSALRDTLLPKLISGELRIRDAERIIEVAA